jgi:hypothetical protein
MTPKQAIALAKAWILDIFDDEGIKDVTLEEVRFDDERGHWLITIGFYRPLSAATARAVIPPAGALLGTPRMRKAFKTVRLDNHSEAVLGIEHRAVEGVDA